MLHWYYILHMAIMMEQIYLDLKYLIIVCSYVYAF